MLWLLEDNFPQEHLIKTCLKNRKENTFKIKCKLYTFSFVIYLLNFYVFFIFNIRQTEIDMCKHIWHWLLLNIGVVSVFIAIWSQAMRRIGRPNKSLRLSCAKISPCSGIFIVSNVTNSTELRETIHGVA